MSIKGFKFGFEHAKLKVRIGVIANMKKKYPNSYVTNLPEDFFKECLQKSKTWTEFQRALGLPINKSEHNKRIKARMEELGLNDNHFKYKNQKGADFKRRYSNEQVFCKNQPLARGHIKRRIINENLIEYKCSCCGNQGQWMGKPLTLTLDHINGINDDNRLENLRFVCPNCDSQSEFYAGKNKKDLQIFQKKILRKKGVKMKRRITQATLESREKRRKVKQRPTERELLELVKEKQILEISKNYGVSDNTIRKWFKNYGIQDSLPKRGFWNKKKYNKI